LPPCHLVTLSVIANFPRALITSATIGAACAILSVIVVLRRWAFIGEGIAHAGFGGVGTAWLLSLAFPALAGSESVFAVAAIFCMVVGILIARATLHHGSRGERFGADTAIGLFMGAALAWGFLCLAIYNHRHPLATAAAAENYLFGTMELVSPQMMLAALAVSAAVIVCVAALFKEIFCYAFDPLMARVEGVPTGFIHFLLLILISLTIVIAMRIAGNILVTALLVLPGAAALVVTRKIQRVIATAVVVSLVACIVGPLITRYWLPSFPSGPAIVLTLFIEFVACYLAGKFPRRSTD
jgi:ABC-type Mn2+/Zn2+ transport system permease subunit